VDFFEQADATEQLPAFRPVDPGRNFFARRRINAAIPERAFRRKAPSQPT
jgi:hypothetical protein